MSFWEVEKRQMCKIREEETMQERRWRVAFKFSAAKMRKILTVYFMHTVLYYYLFGISVRVHYGNEVMLLCLTITHWLWILLLKVWLLLDGGFKWIVLRSDKELIARNKSPEQWRKATHGVARRYRLLRWGNGVLDCQDGLEFYFILFCWLLTMMRDSGTGGRGQAWEPF